jgi:hypothetical protein
VEKIQDRTIYEDAYIFLHPLVTPWVLMDQSRFSGIILLYRIDGKFGGEVVIYYLSAQLIPNLVASNSQTRSRL